MNTQGASKTKTSNIPRDQGTGGASPAPHLSRNVRMNHVQDLGFKFKGFWLRDADLGFEFWV